MSDKIKIGKLEKGLQKYDSEIEVERKKNSCDVVLPNKEKLALPVINGFIEEDSSYKACKFTAAYIAAETGDKTIRPSDIYAHVTAPSYTAERLAASVFALSLVVVALFMLSNSDVMTGFVVGDVSVSSGGAKFLFGLIVVLIVALAFKIFKKKK